LPSDHWYSEVFRAIPDLVCHLLPGPAAADFSSSTGPEAEPERETAYIFRPVALKKVAHHPDGVLWPRLGAETFRLLQQHEEVAHLQVLVLLAHRHLALGTSQPLLLRRFLEHDVTWVDLAALARQPDLDPLLALLTLPVQKEPDLGPCAQRILTLRPDLIELIVPILSERFQGLSPSQLMATLGISKDFWRHTRAFQDILQEGRQEGVELGRQEGRKLGQEEGRRRQAGALALRQLERRCGSIDAPTSARIEALSLPQLEELALALLDFSSAQDLQTWLEQLQP
jgi:hypothetical protein